MSPTPDWHLERYRPLLHLRARQVQLHPRFGRRFDSSDLVQETLLRAHAGLKDFRGTTEAELLQWLQEIQSHSLQDEIRKAKAGKRDLDREQSLQAAVAESSARLDAFLAADQSSPSERAEREEMLLHLAAAIEQLPEDQRDVVIARDVMGSAVAVIAAQLGRTEKSVAGLLLRGRQRLRELLADLKGDEHAT